MIELVSERSLGGSALQCSQSRVQVFDGRLPDASSCSLHHPEDLCPVA